MSGQPTAPLREHMKGSYAMQTGDAVPEAIRHIASNAILGISPQTLSWIQGDLLVEG